MSPSKALSKPPARQVRTSWVSHPFISFPNSHPLTNCSCLSAISPWQFKDLNDGNPEDSWVAYSDYLLASRYHSAVTQVHPDIIELQTWNDWSESHYLRDLPASFASGPASATLGPMLNYVQNTTHAPWRLIANYYNSWYKNGVAPNATTDQVVYWYRRHPKGASCSGGGSNVRNAALPSDAVFAWALASEAGTKVSMSAGANALWEFEPEAGAPTMGMVPFPADLGDGVLPEISITRGGQTITGNASVWITSDCEYQDFNPVVGLVGSGEKLNAVGMKVIT